LTLYLPFDTDFFPDSAGVGGAVVSTAVSLAAGGVASKAAYFPNNVAESFETAPTCSVVVPNPANPNGNNVPLTVALWAKFTNVAASVVYQTIFSLTSRTPGQGAGGMNFDAGTHFGTPLPFAAALAMPVYWNARATSTMMAVPNKWIHIALTVDSAFAVTLYLNGSAAATGEGVAPFANADVWFLGGDGKDFSRGFNGYIDEFCVFNRSLSAAEVVANMDAALAVGPSPPLAQGPGPPSSRPTGGSVQVTPSHRIHTFIGAGSYAFTTPTAMLVDVLVVAGGGAGGGGVSRTAGGGGGGGVIFRTAYSVQAGSVTVVVGAGGDWAPFGTDPASPQLLLNGGGSTFGALTAIGGGGGSGGFPQEFMFLVAGAGGSGGGILHGSATTAGAGTSGQGYGGGAVSYDSTLHSGTFAGSGGGGGGSAGQSGTSNSTGTFAGSGGAGFLCNISGVAQYYAGGGGGSAQACNGQTNVYAGAGGSGGGGTGVADLSTGMCNGAYSPVQSGAAQGAPNTGGGGGGAAKYFPQSSTPSNIFGGNGGSGIVIVRYSAMQ
jgi:hypothetical protein